VDDANPLVRIGELTFHAEDGCLDGEVRARFDPAATIRLNGKEADVDGYLQHVRELRSAMSVGTITVVAALRDDRGPSGMAAARVVVRMSMADGSTVLGESHLIGSLGADGRITRMVEIGRLIEDGDDPA
jgi:hypothetical protein